MRKEPKFWLKGQPNNNVIQSPAVLWEPQARDMSCIREGPSLKLVLCPLHELQIHFHSFPRTILFLPSL